MILCSNYDHYWNGPSIYNQDLIDKYYIIGGNELTISIFGSTNFSMFIWLILYFSIYIDFPNYS